MSTGSGALSRILRADKRSTRAFWGRGYSSHSSVCEAGGGLKAQCLSLSSATVVLIAAFSSPSGSPPPQKSMPALRLVYFPVRAKAEMIRMALAYGRLAHEEIAPTIFFGGKSWREGGKEQAPFSQLPLLEVDGTVLAQSGSIMRYGNHPRVSHRRRVGG